MHEQTQRLILLLIFYIFGPMVTLGIIGGIVVRKLPFHARSWEYSLAQQTGLRWKIKSVEYRSPGFVRLHSVEIKDEADQHLVFRAGKIDVRHASTTRRGKFFPGMAATPKSAGLTAWLVETFPSLDSTNYFWQISISDSYLDFRNYSDEASALLVQNMLQKLFARFTTLSEVPVRFYFEEIAVVSEYSLKKEGNTIEDKIDIFRNVQGNIYQTATEVRSDWEFQIKDVSEFDKVYLAFALSLTDTLQISFQTGKPIPCNLASVFCSMFQHFSGGSFQGKFALSTRNRTNDHTIQLENVTFKDVPLAPLVRRYTDFAVAGTVADLHIEQATFGIEGNSAIGHLMVVNGAIESALFHRCVGNFDLKLDDDSILSLPQQMIPFSGCAVHFHLQPRGIDFWADTKWGNAIMYKDANYGGSNTMVVRLPETRQTVTFYELMSIFASDNAPVVPVTQGLKNILTVLPTL